jgi:glycosyltransferase involved in cell wall biosynthesis
VLAAGPGKTEDFGWVQHAGVPAVIVPSLRRDPHPVADLRAFWQLLRLIRHERPDILHTHSAKGGILGRWAGWLVRVPHIVHTPHGHVLYGYARGFKNWLYLLAERVTAPVTDRLVALSEGERRESIEHGIGRADQWVVIPSGVPLEGIEERSAEATGPGPGGVSSAGPLRIGTVARLEPVKGIDLLIRATPLLLDSSALTGTSFELLVWGDGVEREDLIHLIEDEGVTGEVHLEGTTQDVNEFLAGLSIYVQPSRNEGMGRALVLAQAHGLPVVASRVCGIPDVVQDGESGILVNSDDPETLASAIESLLLDADLRARFSDAARDWISDVDETGYARFSVEAMIWRLDHLYSQLMGHEE